jgi:DNA-binding transcriptional MerR regulator
MMIHYTLDRTKMQVVDKRRIAPTPILKQAVILKRFCKASARSKKTLAPDAASDLRMKCEGRRLMRKAVPTLFQAHEFAARTGVTVRALHHYDRLGLLKPTSYTQAGYRLYGEQDFARLQQIVTLKFIGLPLKQIKELLNRNALDLPATLRLQRAVIVEKRCQLDAALSAITSAEQLIAADGATDWESLKKIIEVINMHKDMNWTDKFFSDEAREALAEKRRTVSQEEVEQGQRDWTVLIQEVEAAVKAGVDPKSEEAQALAARWSALIEAFTGGNRAIHEGLNKMHSDKANWPATKPRPYSDEAMAFIRQCFAAREKQP